MADHDTERLLSGFADHLLKNRLADGERGTGETPVLRERGRARARRRVRCAGRKQRRTFVHRVCVRKATHPLHVFPSRMKQHFVGYPSSNRLVSEARTVATRFGD